jgi:hypothetical protein
VASFISQAEIDEELDKRAQFVEDQNLMLFIHSLLLFISFLPSRTSGASYSLRDNALELFEALFEEILRSISRVCGGSDSASRRHFLALFALDGLFDLAIDGLEDALPPVMRVPVPYPVVFEQRVEELLSLVLRQEIYVVAALQYRV